MENAKIKMLLLMRGNVGMEVAELKKALRKTLGDGAAAYPGLDATDEFNVNTETALRAWQSSVGLVADGIAGPRTLSALGISPPAELAVSVDIAVVSKLFPFTRTSNIARNLPYVTAALAAFGLTDANMISVALGTIRAETEGFVPIAELPSHFNTLPGQAAFSAYEGRLGKENPGDGGRYRGRGFVQLTGRDNYEKYGKMLDIPLADNPDSACAPEVAACLLAAFLDTHREKLSKALDKGDLKAARKVVNGDSHGLERFSETYRMAQKAWADAAKPPVGAKAMATAPVAARRASLNVTPDVTDLRDGRICRRRILCRRYARRMTKSNNSWAPILKPDLFWIRGRKGHAPVSAWLASLTTCVGDLRECRETRVGQSTHVVPIRPTFR